MSANRPILPVEGCSDSAPFWKYCVYLDPVHGASVRAGPVRLVWTSTTPPRNCPPCVHPRSCNVQMWGRDVRDFGATPLLALQAAEAQHGLGEVAAPGDPSHRLVSIDGGMCGERGELRCP